MAHRRLNLTRPMSTEKAISDFNLETAIIESDEVWNFNSQLIGYDPVYFSQGINAKRLISYAASFGHSPVSDSFPEGLPGLLSRFDRISVRDRNSVEWVKKLTGKTPDLSLDPCFLHDFQSEASVCPKRDFVLVYGGVSKFIDIEIQKYAQEKEKPIVSVGYPCAWANFSMDSINPFQWLGYFANCDCVVTSMYHGVVFALIFNKPFCAFVNPAKRIKIYDLLSRLDLLDRIVDKDNSAMDILNKERDYFAIQDSLAHLRETSKTYLIKALQE